MANPYSPEYITMNTVTKWIWQCATCPTGSYAYSGASACTPCEAGKFKSDSGLTDCSICSAGKSSSVGATSCSVCPSGKYSVTHSGDTVTYQSCETCPTGKVSQDWNVPFFPGSDSCTACAGGSSPAADQKSCIPCAAGKYDAFNSGECFDTLPGTFTSATGQLNFVTITDSGSVSRYGAVAPQTCEAGYFSELLRSYTLQVRGEDHGLQSRVCTVCPAGKYGQQGGCVDAQVGYFTDGQIVPLQQTACPAGKITSASGQSSCIACPAGKSTGGVSGASQCINCPNGKYSAFASADCTACPEGKIGTFSGDIDVSGGLSLTVDALKDNVVNNVASPCVPGTYTDIPFTKATGQGSNAAGTVVCGDAPPVITSITVTASGSGYTESTSVEIAAGLLGLGSGLFSINNLAPPTPSGCAFCPNGHTSEGGTYTTCSACPETTKYSIHAVPSCVSTCPARSITSTAEPFFCETCPAGYFLDDDGTEAVFMSNCKKCAAGKYSYGGEGCSECAAGTYSTEGSSFCTPCPANTISSSPGAASCAYCPENQTPTSKASCGACSAGRYSKPGSNGINECTTCEAGQYMQTSTATCVLCVAGKFSDANTISACAICPAGRYSGNAAKECIPCGAGTYAAENANVCTACPTGKYSRGEQDPGGSACTDCEAGKYGLISDGKPSCSSCGPGKYSIAGASVCADCVAGKYCNSAEGCSVCPFCPVGTYSATSGQGVCAEVPPGMYGVSAEANADTRIDASLTHGATQIQQCPAGTFSSGSVRFGTDVYSIQGTDAYIAMAINNKTAVTTKMACVPCPAGYWQAAPNKDSCDALNAGFEGYDGTSSNKLIGASEQRACVAGTYKTVGMVKCEACALGTYYSYSIQRGLLSENLVAHIGNNAPEVNYVNGDYNGVALIGGSGTGALLTVTVIGNAISAIVVNNPGTGYVVGDVLTISASAMNLQGVSDRTLTLQANDLFVIGNTACQVPAAGSFSTVGADSTAVASGATAGNQVCPRGTYGGIVAIPGSLFASSGAVCLACDKGKYQASTGASGCTFTDQGYYPSDANGVYLFEGAVMQTACPKGSYKEIAGTSDCIKCPLGKFADVTALQVCKTPDSNYVAGDASGSAVASGAVQEVPCPAGSVKKKNTNSCELCQVGTSSSSGDTSCIACTVGKANPTAGGLCVDCAAGKYANLPAHVSACQPCGYGTYQPGVGMSECLPCSPGFETAETGRLFPGDCKICEVGKSMQNSNTEMTGQCQSCAGASYAESPGLVSCTRCPAGKYGPVGSNSRNNCQSCPDGTSTIEPFTGSTATACTACANGKYSSSLTNYLCDEVTKGYFPNTRVGASSIMPCPPGSYGESNMAIVLAADDTMGVPGTRGYCFMCIENWTSNAGSSNEKFTVGAFPGCFMCPAGTYRLYSRPNTYEELGPTSPMSICSKCPKGKSTNGIVSFNANDPFTFPGYSNGYNVLTSGERCVDCPLKFYADVEGLDDCYVCPGGRLTPLTGSTDVKQCLSPVQNFVTGFVVLGIVALVALEYVIHARFHRISFLRQSRVATRLVKEARSAMASLYYYAARSEAERKRDYTKRLFKTWLFLLSGVIMGLMITLIIFIASMGSVFFKSMILWRGLEIDLAFVDTMVDSVKSLGRSLGLPSLAVLFYPFQATFDYFSSIDLGAIMASVNVTCDGASAPLELLTNLVILGVTIIIIESNFQLFRAITFNSVTDKFIQSVSQPSYKAWVYRNRGTSAIKTKKGWHHYLWTLSWVLVVRIGGGFDFFQSFLQFLMSVVSLSKFANPEAEYPFTHKSSPECNHVDGYEYYDKYIALAASVEAYLLLLPAIYELSKVLIPGLPPGSASLQDISKKRDPRWSIFHYVKYSSWMMPELWLSVGASAWIRYVKKNIPTTYGRNSVALTDQEIEDKEAHRAEIEAAQRRADEVRQKEIDYKGSRVEQVQERRLSFARVTESMKIKDDEQLERIASSTVKSKAAFRIVAVGTKGTELKSRDHQSMTLNRGFFFAKAGYNIKLWEAFPSVLVDNAYYLSKIERSTGFCIFSRPYDIQKDGKLTEGRVLADLVADLNMCTDEHLICVYTSGDPKPNRLSGGLPEALYRCGASRNQFGADEFEAHCAYALVSVGGCGENAGLEICQGGGKSGVHAVIDVSFEVHDDGFKMLDVHKDDVEEYWCLPSDSYLLTAFQKRTQQENFEWKEAQKISLPSYWTLCKLEYSELRHGYCESLGVWGNFPCFIVAMIGFGHIFTAVGRQAWYLVAWKLYKFMLLCFGVWSDDVVEMFKVHECIKNMSVVWEKPYKRKSDEAYAAYREKISQNRAEELRKKRIVADSDSRPFWSFRYTPTPKILSASDEYIEKKMAHAMKRHTESEEMDTVQLEESKRKLRQDYSALVSAIVSTRSVILQLIPSLTVVSIFASIMSGTPIFVSSKKLHRNLPEMIISEPFTEARAQEQESIDETEWIRKTQVSEEQNCVPNPYHKMVRGKLRVVSREAREAIEKGNEYSRAKMRRIINMPSRTVDEWVVAINGLALYVTESRLINFGINLYRFILTIGILYSKPENLKFWMLSAIVILVPYAWLLACKVTVIVGKALYITDSDLWAALDCVGLTCLLKWLTDVAGATKDFDSETRAVLKARKEREADIQRRKEEEDSDEEDHDKVPILDDDDESKFEKEDEEDKKDIEMTVRSKFDKKVKSLRKDLGYAPLVQPENHLLPDDHPVLSVKRGVVALSYANKMNFGQKRVEEVADATRSVVVHEAGVSVRNAPSIHGKVMYVLECGDECSVTSVQQRSEDPNERLVYFAQLVDGMWVTIFKGTDRMIRGVKEIADEAAEVEMQHAAQEALLAKLVASLPFGDYESVWPLALGMKGAKGEPVRATASAKGKIVSYLLPGTPMEVVGLCLGSASEPGTAWAELSGGGFFPLYRDGTQGLQNLESLKASKAAAQEEAAKVVEQARSRHQQKEAARFVALAQGAADSHTAGNFKVVFEHGCNIRAEPSDSAEIVGAVDFDDVIEVSERVVLDGPSVFVQSTGGGWLPLLKRGVEVLHPTTYQMYQALPAAPEKEPLMDRDGNDTLEELDMNDLYATDKGMIGAPSFDPRGDMLPKPPPAEETPKL